MAEQQTSHMFTRSREKTNINSLNVLIFEAVKQRPPPGSGALGSHLLPALSRLTLYNCSQRQHLHVYFACLTRLMAAGII